ncbi:MAG: threonine--tRNA ligase [Rickettsiales bacterium]|nr:threonine--tRNA ligase [Rickettsiales bacterium]OUV79578.1 MAG: threonine--tRNA ligase [Rickettsiales bacterium TMED131]|tara:strand:- start:101 stop:2032 length:1932 start_codon:yes stop_codon:yes gene_type:complete
MNKEGKIELTFPDGLKRLFNTGINGIEVAKSISKSLSKEAVAIEVDGIEVDLCDEIMNDSNINILTINNKKGLDIMRHTLTAQVLAKAVKKIYPNSKLAIGPTIENGFYYDFLFEKPISEEDLPKIEKEMKKIISTGAEIKKILKPKKDVIDMFQKRNEDYKVNIIESANQENDFSVYCQENTDFIDLCKGPHLPNLKLIGAFKLTKISGAYWKGDSKNEMLQRIYGTAWKNKKDLDEHLNMLEEAERRDHRLLGKKMDLFHFQEEAPGAVFWHAKGWSLFQSLINYMRKKQDESGYQEINTPEILDKSLWEKSGHLDKFGDNMFTTVTRDEKEFAIKPMNCPGGVQVFKQGLKSYRDLPYKIAEFGKVHRYEPSGALHGLMRVRAFTQDDAHIFCTEEQIEEECMKLCNLIINIYKHFGFENIVIKYSDRPEKRVGSNTVWDKSEAALLNTVKKLKLPYKVNPGEGAFYGPKLEFVLRDAIGRDWQCGTVQIDLNMPTRLDASFVNKEGNKQPPVMIHRALFGSLERFTGILLEHYAGNLPLWLSPIQAVIATITEKFDIYAKEVSEALGAKKIKVELDLRNEKIGYKIREHSNAKIPIILIIGEKEKANKSVAVRKLGSNKVESYLLKDFIDLIHNESLKK